MKPMTPEEFTRALNAKINWNPIYTKLPPTIMEIHKRHFRTAAKIELWLNQIDCETPYEFYAKQGIKQIEEWLEQQTSFEIEIKHNNDYIEMGPNFEDPEDKMFHIITPFHIEVKFKPEDLSYITQQLELFSEKKLFVNIKLSRVNLEFYSWQRKIELKGSTINGVKLAYNLKFEIRHIWK